MKHVMLLMVLATMAFGGSFTGVITDTMCVDDHASMKMGSDPECVKACVRTHGSRYALLVGKQVYKLSDQETPATYAGQKVKVTGTLYEKTGIIKVESIEAVK